ncbi:MAG: (2Fe-2S)-binding protein [Balneolales bacterium]|nr:(2Fe-2S)-binding protein [Balneolales bacterium]
MAYDRRSVKMCVCHKKKFAQIKEICDKEGLKTLDDIIHSDVAAKGCGMCHPYIEKMLITGETCFIPGDVYINSEK